MHSKPVSSSQFTSQPSPEYALPSSHASLALTMPSPQMALHVPSAAQLELSWRPDVQPSS